MRVSIASAALLGLAFRAAAIDPIVTKGSKFFNSKTGEQFFIKGVAYQPDIESTSQVRDPLADKAICTRDLPFLKDMGVNAIRVYQTEPFGNHDDCMKMLSDAGIYVLLDLSTPTETINRETPTYDVDLYGYYKQKIDTFGEYDNILGFFAGNEVTNAVNNTDASAFVKAVIRDTRSYIKEKGLSIPVGYAANDDADIRWQLQTYFDCGSTDEQAEFLAINLYEWCGDDATFETSGYADVVKNATGWDIPYILGEYGCNAIRPRTFTEIASIYGSDMTDVFSGGFVYEYVEEANGYGLVEVSGSKATKTEDYANFKTALAAAKPSGVKMSSYSPSGKQQTCPKVGSDYHWVASSTLPPTPSNATCECMMKSLSCTSKLTAMPTSASDLKSFGQNVGQIFGTVCASIDCGDVSTDASKGEYGKYSGCNALQRVSWVVNAWYENERMVDGSCDFDGFATTAKPSLSDDSSCSSQKDSSSSGSSSHTSGSNSDDSEDDSSSGASRAGVVSAAAAAIIAAALF
ncbi:1 3-beta-glucanosyltransferase gel4 [Coemansia sp. RSA 1591]|nr:1 3-beta-glucanosyltransferase gel4 [Coemansia sp. RSA 1591]KAJ1760043.1 1 3-beta-glucanosyltransferase gel4 [Coemansia sp. RSA 1752]KAJ1786618.1 1 3-beta-glucanosyltransferase gel4 [Coemansia sp. RSA 1938]